ncbi:hypothetical protein AB9128_26190 [Streptomyces cinereoruber]|uniref:hypothetical protein n=1 Tax=Streptomyces cinereoruber TaxID=67260 RepID=UPI003EBFAFF3
MKRLKTAVVAVVTVAGLAAAVTPAQAADICNTGGAGRYVCDYGIKKHSLPNGEREEFVVGADYAVWTRWTTKGTWSSWTSMGKPDPFGNANAASGISLRDEQSLGDFRTTIYLQNSNGTLVSRTRAALGAGWFAWDFPNCC